MNSLSDRFHSRYEVDEVSGCWIWTALIRPDGYGSIWDSARQRKNLAHRVSLELTGIEIPLGMHTDHLCRNRACVNPAHLEVVSHRENMRRGMAWPGQNARKTHCPQGHPYSGDNLQINTRGERLCRKCISAANLRQRIKRQSRQT